MEPIATPIGRSQPSWEQVNREQDAELATRARVLTVAQRLERGLSLSRTAAELRRAAWEARHGHPAI